MVIIDHEELHVYGFNYTRRDYQSRSFGIETTNHPTTTPSGHNEASGNDAPERIAWERTE